MFCWDVFAAPEGIVFSANIPHIFIDEPQHNIGMTRKGME